MTVKVTTRFDEPRGYCVHCNNQVEQRVLFLFSFYIQYVHLVVRVFLKIGCYHMLSYSIRSVQIGNDLRSFTSFLLGHSVPSEARL